MVTVNYSKWDWHGGRNSEGRANNSIFLREKEDFPIFDKAITALIDDLHDRGLDEDTAVLVWGEFGRTPKINKKNSRDHWPRVIAALVAGGNMQTGQVIGETNKYAEHAVKRPVKFQEIFATLYDHLGLDAHRDRIFDGSGTPRYPVDPGVDPIRDLL